MARLTRGDCWIARSCRSADLSCQRAGKLTRPRIGPLAAFARVDRRRGRGWLSSALTGSSRPTTSSRFISNSKPAANASPSWPSCSSRTAFAWGWSGDAPPEARQGKTFEFIHTADALLMLLSGVPAKNLGSIVDLWDLHVSGGSLEALKKLGGERLVAVRLADAPADVPAAECKTTQRLLPGEGGAVDSSAAPVALAEMGFDGPVTLTAHAEQLKGLRREAAVKRRSGARARCGRGRG